MMKWLERARHSKVAASAGVLTALVLVPVLVMAVPASPLNAQDNVMDARVRAMEAEIRALQRKVFPGDGKFFPAEIAPGGTAGQTAAGQGAATPVADLLSRMEAVEAQLKRLTAQSEESANRLAQLEAKVSGTAAPAAASATAATPPAAGTSAAVTVPPVAATPVATPSPTPAASPAPASSPAPAATSSNLSTMTGGASAPKPAAAPAARPAAPSAQRLAAVRAIAKPETQDPGDDEYSYGFRLWEAKFFPEAQQQLKLMIDRYPRHAKISHARNLLGRAYLDDAKPRDGATWFLQNYQANKSGERAADSLLYLAESMRQLKDTNRACIALSEFGTSFPREAAGRLKAQYDATRGGVKCN